MSDGDRLDDWCARAVALREELQTIPGVSATLSVTLNPPPGKGVWLTAEDVTEHLYTLNRLNSVVTFDEDSDLGRRLNNLRRALEEALKRPAGKLP